MKKLFAILSALVMILSLTAVSLAEEEDYGALYPESLVYDSAWESDDIHMEIFCEDGGFKIAIVQDTDYPEGILWQYSAFYNEESGALDAFLGIKNLLTCDENGDLVIGDEIADELSATFEINGEGKLIWTDESEDAGNGVEFVKIGWYDGTHWVTEDFSFFISINWGHEGYKVFITAGSEEHLTTWTYLCDYDAETDSLTGLGTRAEEMYDENGALVSYVEVYESGEATFSLDENGRLIWNDRVENAGNGIVFEDLEILMLDSNG